MKFIEMIAEKAKAKYPTLVFVEGEQLAIVKAARKCYDLGIGKGILLGSKEVIEGLGVDLTGLSIIDVSQQTEQQEKYAQYFEEVNDFPAEAILPMLSDNLNYGCMMMAAGDADAMVAGYIYTSADVYKSSELFIGLKEGIITPNSYCVAEIPGWEGGEMGVTMFGDVTMVAQPSAEELAAIAINIAESSKTLLGWEPKVALLSFSTKGSAEHPDVHKVRKALEIARQKAPELLIDGELQLDAAIIPRLSEKKIKGENVLHGKANILVFPDLDAGNIAIKLVQNYAHADIYTVLCGFNKPLTDLSRSMSVNDIVGGASIAAALV